MQNSVLTIKEDRNILYLLAIAAPVLGFLSLKGLHLPYWILIPFVLAASFVLFVWSQSRPQILYYTLAFYLPFAKQIHFKFGPLSPILNLTNLFVLMMLFNYGKQVIQNRLAFPKPIFFETVFYLFLVLILFSISGEYLIGFDYLATTLLQFYSSWLIPFLFFFLVYHSSLNREQMKNVVLIIMAVTTLVAGLATVDYLLNGERVGGVFDHANILSSFFSYYMFLPFSFFILEFPFRTAWVYLFSFAVCSRGIMVAFSRGGYLAFATSMYVITFFRNKWLFALLLAFSVIVFTNPQILPSGVRYRLGKTIVTEKAKNGSQSYEKTHLDRSSADRIEIWKAAIEMIKDHPLQGIGYNRFIAKVQHYWYAGIVFEPHNTFLWICAEIGIPGCILFILLLILIASQSFLLYHKADFLFDRGLGLGMLASIAGLIVSNLYAPRLDYPEVGGYFWILAALVYRLRNFRRVLKS